MGGGYRLVTRAHRVDQTLACPQGRLPARAAGVSTGSTSAGWVPSLRCARWTELHHRYPQGGLGAAHRSSSLSRWPSGGLGAYLAVISARPSRLRRLSRGACSIFVSPRRPLVPRGLLLTRSDRRT